MAYTGRLPDWLGSGTAAARPASLNLPPDGVGFYFANDTLDLSLWDVTGAAWVTVGGGGGAVASVNGQTGVVLLTLEDLTNVLAGTGAAVAGDVLTADGLGGWVAEPPPTAAVLSVNGYTGAVQLGLENLVDVIMNTGGGVDPGALLYFDPNLLAWTPLDPGTLGQVLTIAVSGAPAWEAPGSAAVTSVNGQTGAVLLGLDDLVDVLTGTGIAAAGDVLTADGLGGWTAETPAAKADVTALSIVSGVVNIDCSLGDYFTLTLTANVTSITFTSLPGSGKGASKMVQITQGAGPFTVAFPAAFDWAGGSTGVVSTANGAIDVLAITTFDNGTAWRATLAKAFA